MRVDLGNDGAADSFEIQQGERRRVVYFNGTELAFEKYELDAGLSGACFMRT